MSALGRMYRNEHNVPFRRLWRPVMIVSLVVVSIGSAALAIEGLELGLEFEGGAAWEVEASGVTADDARDVLRPLGLADARIQTGGGVLRVRANLQAEDAKVVDVSAALAELSGRPVSDVSVDAAGPSWGDEITDKAVRALVVFFVVIAAYITLRLRWEMAVAALVAVVHDILFTVGFYAVFRFEVTPSTVIAFLTIMGYSLYDTLVVFDRVRDNEYRMANAGRSYSDVMEISLNQTLMRSINTTTTSLIPVLSVLIVGSSLKGAVTLREFALALLLGLLSGAFSSVFIAAPVATWLRNRFGSAAGDNTTSYRVSDGVKVRRRPTTTPPVVAAGTGAGGAIPPRPRKKRSR